MKTEVPFGLDASLPPSVLVSWQSTNPADEMHAGIGIVNDPYEPPLFRDECFIAFVISHLRTEFALPDDLVVQEGTLATAMYFLIQGRCQVIGNYNKKNEEVFNTLAEGDHFGEIGVLMQVGGPLMHGLWPVVLSSACMRLTLAPSLSLSRSLPPSRTLHFICLLSRIR